jgi:hypothetical protein
MVEIFELLESDRTGSGLVQRDGRLKFNRHFSVVCKGVKQFPADSLPVARQKLACRLVKPVSAGYQSDATRDLQVASN